MIQRFASESKITKNRARLENISVRKADSLFFDIPNFIHVERSNLPKVLPVKVQDSTVDQNQQKKVQ